MDCTLCGKCCWNWKENKPEDKCEYLSDDLKTCLIHDRLAELRPECADFPHIQQVCDLPEDCGYIAKWKSKGLI